jgi:hypothetical protein
VLNLAFSDRTNDELRGELALIRRDLLERIRRLEDYIMVLDSDIRRLGLEIQRINDKLQDIPLDKITMQIGKPSTTVTEIIRSTIPEQSMTRLESESIPVVQTAQTSSSIALVSQVKNYEKKEGLNQTEVAIIKYLIDNPGTKSATPIAQIVGKAREHIARTLKKLADEKKIIRDETTWPYTYIVPEEIRKIVQSQSSETSPPVLNTQ